MENLSPYKMMHNFVQSAPIEKFVQKKNGFDYLPWSIAYHYAKTVFPTCKIIKHTYRCDTSNETIAPYMKDPQGHAWVQCSIIWEGFETSEIFPITDFRNQPIKNPTSKAVDNALQRCMTKCVAMFCGLGLQLWHGEDLPVSSDLGSPKSKDEMGEGGQSTKSNDDALKSERQIPESSPSTPNNFKSVGVSIEQQISMCPTRADLTALYRREKDNLTKQQVELFQQKGKELA